MVSRKDCIDEIARKTGRSREQVSDDLNDILDRADGYQHDGLSPDESYAKARDEKLEELGEAAALRRRSEMLDAKKAIARHRFYSTTEKAIKELSPKHALQAARYALEAKLVGVNLPFFKNRQSVDAQFVALRKLWVGGFARDLDKAPGGSLLKLFASRSIEKDWTDELFELNRGKYGQPGKTKNPQALAIAKTIRKWQAVSIAALNREGAWVRTYSGYVTRTSHDADAIRFAGPDKWVADTIGKLDLPRTFGTSDRQRALDALREMWTPMKDGNHFDYGKPVDEPLYPNTGRQASDARELHFKSGADWRAYNEQYGVNNPTHTVVQAYVTAAQRTALMKEFGTRPRENYEADKAYLLATLQQGSKARVAKLGTLQDAHAAAPTPELAKQIADITAENKAAAGKFENFETWQQALDNRFAQIDGSSKRPVNRTLANVASGWMAVQRMAKLGRVALTHFASLPSKAMEARYWGVPFADRYKSLTRGFTSGAEGSAKREALDSTLVAFEARLGHIMQFYDVADAPAGFLTRWESTFFKLTGVSSVLDNQRGDAEAMFSAYTGSKRGQAWADIGADHQRVLQGFGLGEKEWKALNGVEWSQFGERTYLTPSDALKLSDQQVAAYLKESQSGPVPPRPDEIAKAREDLALSLATAYSDRAGFAIPMPDARTRAMMFGKNFEPGTGMNTALRLLYQFKMWPATMITRAWGREMSGRIGDPKFDRIAGLVEAAVGALVFGTASETVRSALQNRNPIAEMENSPIGTILKGGQRSGFGSLVGDFLLGEFDRHGFSAVGSLAGPTFSQIDTLMDLLHAGGETKQGMLSLTAMRQRGADALQLIKSNTPFVNLWFTDQALNFALWYRLQEWIRPGYLERSEHNLESQQGAQFMIQPSSVVR